MMLVTGAAGKTGQAVIRVLLERRRPVRALVHRPEQAQVVERLGVKQVIWGDMRDRATMEQAFRGVRAVYHICPNVSPDELVMGQTAIAAAQKLRVEHFVYHSVLHPQTEAMPHHWLKLRVEEQLLESHLPCTILQPAVYMQNLLAHWNQIQQQGIYPVPYRPETRLSMVDLEDVAEVAALVLNAPEHLGATYELVGTWPMSQMDVAAILSQELQRPVRAAPMVLGAWEQRVRSSGLADYQVNALLSMFRYYERHGFHGSPRVLGWLLGHPPTGLAAFVRRHQHSGAAS